MADGRGKASSKGKNTPKSHTSADRRKTENRLPGQAKPGPKPGRAKRKK